MSLRARLIVLVGLALLISLTCGSGLVAWHEAHSVQTEMRAALDGGEKAVKLGLNHRSHTIQMDELRRLIDTFNGNRHVRASLLDPGGQVLARSEPLAPSVSVPDWFQSVIAIRLLPSRFPVPGADGVVVELQADPVNEIGEVWAEARDAVLVMSLFAALTALLVGVFVTRTLRPLEGLSDAFQRMGTGDFRGVSEGGSPELARLAGGFNAMARQLASAEAQNRRLNERLRTLQAEERAELARDLHDEIGPLLFAVDMTTAAIERLADGSHGDDIRHQAGSIHDAVGRMQRHVRSILERLRPLQAIGLEAAIARLAGFWQTRRPNVGFTVAVTIDEDALGHDTKETAYRVVQEAVSNAVRHGSPARIRIDVSRDDIGSMHITVADDGVGMSGERGAEGFGLIGMRERVMAMAGSLTIQHGDGGKGLTLIARLPLRHAQDALE